MNQIPLFFTTCNFTVDQKRKYLKKNNNTVGTMIFLISIFFFRVPIDANNLLSFAKNKKLFKFKYTENDLKKEAKVLCNQLKNFPNMITLLHNESIFTFS